MSSEVNRDSKSPRQSVRREVEGVLRRYAIRSGVGLTMLATGGFVAQARAGAPPPHFGTPAWFAQKVSQIQSGTAAPSSGGEGSGGVTTPSQASVQLQQSIQDLNNAAALIRARLASQAYAAAHPGAQPSIPDGLAVGGLQVYSATAANPGTPTQSSVASADGTATPIESGLASSNPIVETTKGSQTTVTVNQAAPQALVTWQSFSVGKNTTLDFNQSAGTQTDGDNSWVVLNRVLGGGSTILGDIEAQGSVYLINQNGILFGAGSQVNTNSFLASTLALFSADLDQSNAQFFSTGLIRNPGESLQVLTGSATSGDITIQPGASIAAGEQGFVILAAPSLTNSGAISATDGQVILAAGDNLWLEQPPQAQPQDGDLSAQVVEDVKPASDFMLLNESQGIIQSFRGNITLLGLNVQQDGVLEATTDVTRGGSVTINAEDEPSPVSGSTPPDSGLLQFGSGSVTAILPQEDAENPETTTSSAAATQSFLTSALPTLSFGGGSIEFQGGSEGASGALIEAPGATLNVVSIANTPGFYFPTTVQGGLPVEGRILVGAGATLDVAGLANVQLPVSDTLLTIGPLTQNDLADSPLLKDGFLYTATVTINSTLSGTSADGQQWEGSPIVDATGYIQNIPRTIDELLINGGSVNLSGAEVMTTASSSINVSGGYINYLGGMTTGTTRLLAANGQSYDIGSADPNLDYVGFAGQQAVTSSRWNIAQTYTNPVLSGALDEYVPGFVQGGTGGKLNIAVGGGNGDSVDGTVILDGSISASVVAGRNQVASSAQPVGSQLTVGGVVVGSAAAAAYYLQPEFGAIGGPGFDITTSSPALASEFSISTPLDTADTDPTDRSNLQYWSPINATALSAAGFSSITLAADGSSLIFEEPGASLAVKPSGSLSSSGPPTYDQIVLNGASITINGGLSAPSGLISATTSGGQTATPAPGDINIGSGGVLNASGEWVNDAFLTPDQITGDTLLNGGRIVLTTQQSSYTATGQDIQDTTGSIDLGSGSTLDVSSGGYVQPNGTVLMDGNVPAGAGGSISLLTYVAPGDHPFGAQGAGLPQPPDSIPESGAINIAGANLIGYGFSSGGTLELQAPGIQIGGTDANGASVVAPESEDGTLYLPAGFFQGAAQFRNPQTGTVTTVAGFGSYGLNAEYNATIAGGLNGSQSTISVSQQNLIPSYPALLQTPTGANILAEGAATTGLLDAYDRKPGSFTLTAGDFLNWPIGQQDYSSAVITGTLLVAQNASLVADPGTSIDLGSAGTVEVLGSVTTQGGSMTLNGWSSTALNETTGGLPQSTLPAQAIELGGQAELDSSGTMLVDPFVKPVPINGQQALPVTGTLLPGGSVSLYGADVAAAPGSVIDVSGATAVMDVPQNVTPTAARTTGVYAPTPEWSDAGQITIGASNSLYLESTLSADPGSGLSGTGSGGTLTITALNQASSVELFQSLSSLPAGSPLSLPTGWQPGESIPSAGGTLYLPVDGLNEAGIWNLAINSDTNPDNFAAETPGAIGKVSVAFAGNVDLSLKESFVSDAVAYSALPEPGDTSGSATTVNVFAPYIALDGYYYYYSGQGGLLPSAQVGNSTLNMGNLDASAGPVTQLIDLGGQFSLQGVGQASFSSAGGVRFLNQATFAPGASAVAPPGELYTPGNVTFTAAELYPASASSFVILAGEGEDASGTPNPASVTIDQAPGTTPAVPLSAGGSLLIDAATITQNGSLWAPSGTIVLGVGNPSDSAVQTQFNSTSLVATSSVTLGSGSTTSVSLGGASTVIPYGTTVDGQEWQYNINPAVPAADLQAPPPKVIEVNAASITLAPAAGGQPAAVIDLSGGGELQAEEWVPGVGGTRDVLSQFNTTYLTSASGTGTQVPLYPDERGIYALVPTYEAPVAAYDPIFEQGQAAIATGEAITISGGNGIPAGTYVLMPAKYATLPGSFRVVQDTGVLDSVPADNTVLADGTQLIAGYLSNALTGARESRSVLFEIQSASVWQQYSQYSLTSADTFFSNLAAQAGTVAPQLPRDAGQLVVGASSSLSLGATLDTAPGMGGTAAEVDIASQNIQIVGDNASALPGYLQVSAASLDNLGAGSLLIGGTRSESTSGITIDPLADNVVVSNDSSSALTGSQIILVATDTVAVDAGSVIKAPPGSSGTAPGQPLTIGEASQAGSGDGALLMVSSAGPASLSRVSNTGTGTLSVGAGAELDGGGFLLLDAAGNTDVDSTASLGGNAITADAGAITFVPQATSQSIPGMVIGPQTLALFSDASEVSLRSYGAIDFEGDLNIAVGTASGDSLELSAAAFTAGAYGHAGNQVSISAPTLIVTNEQALNAQTTLTPVSGSTSLQLNGSEIDFGSAAGTNPVIFTGFGAVNVAASSASTASSSPVLSGVVTRNGVFDFGNVDVSINAPVIFAAGGSTTTLETTGTLSLSSSSEMALSTTGSLGGQLSLTGGSISDATTVAAPAGNLSLTATSGEVVVGKGAMLSAAGQAEQFYDVAEYAPGGTISLTSDTENVQVDAGATLDFSGAAGGGNAGMLQVSAPEGSATLLGTIMGGVAQAPAGSAPYTSGSVALTVGGSEDLDTLAGVLKSSGATQSISITSGTADQGAQADNLLLGAGNTLTAQNVSLVANHGSVIIDGTVDADGLAGGDIALYGTQGVDLEGTLTARASASNQLGGNVTLGTSTISSWNPASGLNAQYGYENVDPSASGVITLGSAAMIDVTGGSAGGHSGGTVSFRAPLLDNGDVSINAAPTARIVGATDPGSVTVEPYAVWSTSDPVINLAQHFDGYIDPAGWYDSSGNLVSGTFYNQDGIAIASGSNLGSDPNISTYLSSDYFVPDAANPNHQTFYGYVNGDPSQGAGTLMGFIEAPGFSSSFQSRMAGVAAITGGGTQSTAFAVTPGVELDNPVSANVNNGNIEVLTNWNLGAGTLNADGSVNYAYRYNGAAPSITIRAGNNLEIDASISDGFYQYSKGPDLTYVAAEYTSDLASFQQIAPTLGSATGSTISVNLPGGTITYDLNDNPYYVAFSAPAANQSGDYYTEYNNSKSIYYYQNAIESWNSAISQGSLGSKYTISPGNLDGSAPSVSSYPATEQGYQQYTSAYDTWLSSTYPNQTTLAQRDTTPPPPELPAIVTEPSYMQYLMTWNSYEQQMNLVDGATVFGRPRTGNAFAYIFPPLPPPVSQIAVTAAIDDGNAPADMPTTQDVAPLAYAALAGGDSSSYRLVAGADLQSADPTALEPATAFSTGALAGGGSVMIGGHTALIDEGSASGLELVFPTLVRTGDGSISIAAASDIALTDDVAPGAVYTAGVPVAGTPGDTGASTVSQPSSGEELILSEPVNSQGAGNISLMAQNDIQGIEQVFDGTSADGGAITGTPGQYIGQSWWQWMETDNTSSSSSINFSAFDQGVLSVGGNVSVSAGGNIADLSVSLPTTWRISADASGSQMVSTYGGGNLSVIAGNDILSGSYFVAEGSGLLQAGGAVESNFSLPAIGSNAGSEVSTLIGLQDAQIQVDARGTVDLGGIFDPSYVSTGFDSQGFSTDSSVSVVSVGGDVDVNTLAAPESFFTVPVSTWAAVLPADLSVAALQGAINIEGGGGLYPSPTGELSLVAAGNIDLYSATSLQIGSLAMIDAPPQSMASPLSPTSSDTSGVPFCYVLPCNPNVYAGEHGTTALHADDTVPARIYSLDGSIVDGTLASNGFYINSLLVMPDKEALIYAGQDIVNLNFLGQNLHDSDVTRIIAGQDIYDTPLIPTSGPGGGTVPALILGGPGTFDIEAGRNIGPLINQDEAVTEGYVNINTVGSIVTGIDAVGNAYDPYLAHQSASVDVMFGVGPGIDTAEFISKYIGTPGSTEPGVATVSGVPSYTQQLVDFMDKLRGGALLPLQRRPAGRSCRQRQPDASGSVASIPGAADLHPAAVCGSGIHKHHVYHRAGL